MTACPPPESYGPAALCDATTIPYEPAGTVLATTGVTVEGLVISALVLLLVGAVWVAIAGIGAARGIGRAYDKEHTARVHAETLVQQEQDYSEALETYLPGQKNASRWEQVSPRFDTTKEAYDWLAKHPKEKS